MEQEIAKLTVVLTHPGSEEVKVTKDVACGGLLLDVYRPEATSNRSLLPAVVIVSGYSEPDFVRTVGRSFREMGSVTSMARLMAAVCDCAVITYSNAGRPGPDAAELMDKLLQGAEAAIGIDPNRVALWASSGNSPVALSLIVKHPQICCGAFSYPFLLGPFVAEASAQYKFDNPCAGFSIENIPSKAPLLLVRAGQEEVAGLNASIDKFAADAVERNLPVTLCNASEARHAFEIYQDSDSSRRTIRVILDFLKTHLHDPSAL